MLDRRDGEPAANETGASASGSVSAVARAWRASAGIAAGDHACCTYCGDEDQRGLVRRFATDALSRDMRLRYVTHESAHEAVLACLAQAGVDVAARLEAGQLELLEAPAFRPASGGFDPAAQAARLAEAAAAARADGWSGLAVTAEMSWALEADVDAGRLVTYERAVGRIVAGGDVAALCQYDALALPAGLRERLAAVHPLAIDSGPVGTVTTRGPARVAEMTGVEGMQLAGEIDAFAAPYVRARIGERLAEGRDVVLDLAELTFPDVGASRAFARLAESLDPQLRVVLEGSPPSLRRVMRLCHRDERPGLVVRDDAIVLSAEAVGRR